MTWKHAKLLSVDRKKNKTLNYCRETARRAMSIEILSTASQLYK